MSEFRDCEPDDPDERRDDDSDRTGSDNSAAADGLGPGRHEQSMADFRAGHAPFSPDDPDELDPGLDVVSDDATISMDALKDLLTGPEAESVRADIAIEQSHSIAIRGYRERIRNEAINLLESSNTDELDVGTVADVMIDIVELGGLLIEPVIIPDAIDATELSIESDVVLDDSERDQSVWDIARTIATVEELHDVKDVRIRDKDLARMYFVEWSKLGSEEAHVKLGSLLGQERQDADNAVSYRCLTAVCEVAERMGLSPEDWITRYADKDNAWRLQLEHHERQKERLTQQLRLGVDVARTRQQLQAVNTRIDGLMGQYALPSEDPDALSARAISAYGLRALRSSNTAETNALVAKRFIEAADEMGATPENLTSLYLFGVEALVKGDAVEEDMVEDIDDRINRVTGMLKEALQDPLMRDILATDLESIAQNQARWQIAYDTANGVPTDDILADIRQQEIENASVHGDYLLFAAAVQYVQSGDYTSAHVMITKMTPAQKERAYTQLWGQADDPEQMAALNPIEEVGDLAVVLPARYEIAQALVSGNTTTMVAKALEAVTVLQAFSAMESSGPVFEPFYQWMQIEQLMDKVGKTGGGIELRRLCRAMLVQLQNGPPTTGVVYLKIYEPLEKSGTRADYEAVRASILARPSSDSVKAARLTESALRTGTILVDET